MQKRTENRKHLAFPVVGVPLLLSLLFLLGGITGCILVVRGSDGAAVQLSAFLSEYLVALADGGVSVDRVQLLYHQGLLYLLLFLALTSGFAKVALPLIMLVQGCIFCFSVSCFIFVFGAPGAVPAFVLFGIPMLVGLPMVLFFAGVLPLWSKEWENSGHFGLSEVRIGWVLLFVFALFFAAVLADRFFVSEFISDAARFVVSFYMM